MKRISYLLFFVFIFSFSLFLTGTIYAADNITIQWNDPSGATDSPPSGVNSWTSLYNSSFLSANWDPYSWQIHITIPNDVPDDSTVWLKLEYPKSQWGGVPSNWQDLYVSVPDAHAGQNITLDGTLTLTGCSNTASMLRVQVYYAFVKNIHPVNASCGIADNTCRATAPSASELCAYGTASAISGSGPWSWSCSGASGGVTVYCTASLSTGGSCGSAKNVPTSSKPNIRSLCSSGTASSVNTASDGSWAWTCTSACVGVSCSAPMNGSCGTSNKKSTQNKPSGGGLCLTGTASAVTVAGDGSWAWTCAGSPGGTTASCSAPLSGVCGTANGSIISYPPSATLTVNGGSHSASVAPGGSIPYTWSSTNADSFYSTYASNTCGTGSWTTYTNSLNGSGNWTPVASQVGCTYAITYTAVQSSTGIRASDTVYFNVYNPVPASTTAPIAPSGSSLCAYGTASAVTALGTNSGGPWSWSCLGSTGGTTASCITAPPINGVCGTAAKSQ
jgi:hypothetical protein